MYLGNSGPDEMQDEMKPFDYKDLVNTYGKIASFFVPDPAKGLGFSQYIGYEPPAFALKRPEETAKERAAALLDHATTYRNSGFIEAVTTDFQNEEGWGEFLLSRGFTMVSETVNSNSDNTIQVWLLATNPDYTMGDYDDDYEPYWGNEEGG
jgi:hypothetical protein